MKKIRRKLVFIFSVIFTISFTLAVNVECASANVQDFRLGISCSDKSPGSNVGVSGWTNFVRTGRSDTGWISDSNSYDPDYFKLSYVRGSNILGRNLDFRIGIQMCDGKAGRNVGAVQYTPWASEGGGWSLYAGDSNNYDPDYIKIIVETKKLSGFTASDVRFGLQVCDGGRSGKKHGEALFTPWLSSKSSGNTGWTTDSNGYDPDAVRICLNVKQ